MRSSRETILRDGLLLCLLGTSLGLIFGTKQVCYDNVGCFDDVSPFDNAWKYLPDSPENVQVSFKLFTRSSQGVGTVLDEQNADSVSQANIDVEKPFKFIIHGFSSAGDFPWVKNMTKMFLQQGDYNVIAVDWKKGAKALYPQAAANTRLTAATTVNLIKLLTDEIGANLKSVHLIGHSLGAHICGYIGNAITGVGRITGLDPAGPLFAKKDAAVRLDPTDADFVDTIHSDAVPLLEMGFGTQQQLGHLDFYPNGGTQQPGCPQKAVETGLKDLITLHLHDMEDAVHCSHSRAILLFTESIVNTDCRFLGYPCSTKEKFDQGGCTSCGSGPCPVMGLFADSTPAPYAKYYLKTRSHQPFCISAP